MKKVNIFYLIIFMYIIDAEGFRSIKKEIIPPSHIEYIIKNYIENGDRSTEIGIAIRKENLNSNAKLPVVIFIHGGGWRNGDKQQNVWQCFNYASKDYIAIAISYRLLDEAPFPQCIVDVKTAIRYIKSLSSELPIDIDNIGVWGYSAGAHLALMIALEDSSNLFNSGLYNNFDSKIKCAVAIAAPTYLENRKGGQDKKLSNKQNNDNKFKEKISPITYVNSKQVPILMMHGKEDKIVPSKHYDNFASICNLKGVENFILIEVNGGDHGFYFKNKEHLRKVSEYFEKILKNSQKTVKNSQK